MVHVQGRVLLERILTEENTAKAIDDVRKLGLTWAFPEKVSISPKKYHASIKKLLAEALQRPIGEIASWFDRRYQDVDYLVYVTMDGKSGKKIVTAGFIEGYAVNPELSGPLTRQFVSLIPVKSDYRLRIHDVASTARESFKTNWDDGHFREIRKKYVDFADPMQEKLIELFK